LLVSFLFQKDHFHNHAWRPTSLIFTSKEKKISIYTIHSQNTVTSSSTIIHTLVIITHLQYHNSIQFRIIIQEANQRETTKIFKISIDYNKSKDKIET